MSARALASGTISFGLVSIPVKLYSTSVTGSRVSLNCINRETGSRVRMKYFDPTTLRYADEIRAWDEVPVEEAEVRDAELELARKVEGEEVTAAPQEEPQAQIIDLMEALKTSLGAAPDERQEDSDKSVPKRKGAKKKAGDGARKKGAEG